MTLLEVAAYHGNVDAVQQLLQAQPGPNINHQDTVGKYSYPNIANYLKSVFFIYIYRYGHIYVLTLDAPPPKPILLVVQFELIFFSLKDMAKTHGMLVLDFLIFVSFGV